MPTAKQLNEVIAHLAARFPHTFVVFQEQRKPLKLGIHNDLVAVLGELEHLSAALGYYMRNFGYLRAQKAGAPRIDLDGNAAGSVNEEQAANAQRSLAGFRAKQKAAAEQKQKAAKPPARDGLAALREAGKRRRAAA